MLKTRKTNEIAYICNVGNFPHRKKLLRRYVKPNGRIAGFRNYVLEAADPETGYSVLTVELSYQSVLDRSADPEKPHQYVDRETDAVVEADALVRLWKQVMGSGSGAYPGVGRIAGPKPTAQELKQLKDQHESWCRFLIQDADEMYEDPARRKFVTGLHHRAAEWMRLQHSPEHKWIKGIRADDWKVCLACARHIPMRAHICPECNNDLVEFAINREIPAEEIKAQDKFIAPYVTRARQKASHAETQAAKKAKKKETAEAAA